MFFLCINNKGTLWLSGRVLDLRPRGCEFEPHRRHCVVSLSKTHVSLLSTGSTQEDLSRHNSKIVDWDVKNQIKQKKTKEAEHEAARPSVQTSPKGPGKC